MSIRATFHYFQGMECDMYSFYRIPKLLFTSEYFKNLSCEAKVLYGLMLDRMSLSIKNRWFDEEDRAYIFFSVEEIMEMLNCGRNKAVNCLKELDQEKGIGLIEKKRIGLGKTNVIYVKNFSLQEYPDEPAAIAQENSEENVPDGKSRSDRYTLLADRTLEILTEYWFQCGRPRGILFPSSWTGDYLTKDSVIQFFRESAERAGIQKHVSTHCLRHSFASHLFESGCDIKYIQALLGHRDPKSTEIYLHVSNKTLLGIKSPFDEMGGE